MIQDEDGLCDEGDPDDDDDNALDDVDSDDNNEFVCSDNDEDSCEDCSTGTFDLALDGDDYDEDGLCNDGDPDDDDDTVEDGLDTDPLNANICLDEDEDTCDDCSVAGSPDVSNDGFDYDTDGLCDAGDPDDDGDTVEDDLDTDPLNANICLDEDEDTCDDCSVAGSPDVSNDGFDYDTDGLCDAGDPDDDNDNALDDDDSDDNNANVCSDNDEDTCDDCSTGTFDLALDGDDFDADGLCDAGDPDDDNDNEDDDDDTDQ